MRIPMPGSWRRRILIRLKILMNIVRRYADNFILDEEKKEFLEWHLCANMKRKLLREEKLTYHYRSVSKEGKDSYYEAYVVKAKVDNETFDVFLAYRNIDSILYKEKENQEKLQKALDEARLGNEIISSIARTYQYISRIDLQADYFEEISNRDVEHLKYIHSGTLSENNKKVCREQVAEEYQDAFEQIYRSFYIAGTNERRRICRYGIPDEGRKLA